MHYSFTEKKRIRKSFAKRSIVHQIPFLLATQLESFNAFLQAEIKPSQRKLQGLQAAFDSIFPITSHNGFARLEFVSYTLAPPIFDVKECQQRGLTFCSALRAKVRLVILDKDSPSKPVIKEVKEQEVYMGEIPLMTPTGSFVINGTERVVVSQLHRSPGVFFEHDKGKTHSSGKLLFSARIIPYRGSWLDFEFDPKDILYFRVDRRRKMLVTIMLKALGLNDEQILEHFFDFDTFTLRSEGAQIEFMPERLRGEVASFDILADDGSIIVPRDKRINAKHIRDLEKANTKNLSVPDEYLIGRVLAKAVVDEETGEVIANGNDEITDTLLAALREADTKTIETLYTNDLDQGAYISQTLRIDDTTDQAAARIAIYRMMRPGEPPTEEAVEALFNRLFYDKESYDLSKVGRMKFNRRVGRPDVTGLMTLENQDILATIKILVELRNGRGEVDDIDHLGNRRVRCVGELAENQFRTGLVRVERAVKERLGQAESENLMPHDLINSKPISSAIREFFGSSQLSQFMDQTNPLSEITHKRRVSALGPGGLTRERAGFEVRDVHPTHYGRVCPIETPEGPNIGLINSLALYATINEYGFLETPYRQVKDGTIQSEVNYLSAIEEGQYVIAQANAAVSGEGVLTDELVSAREMGETLMTSPERVQYIDVAPSQIVSVAASLIPFLEHDDANRALMGSNMQRQAVPCLRPEKALVGTGIERTVAVDSGTTVQAARGGLVDYVDASRIVIRVNDNEAADGDSGVDIYNLIKYTRSNQSTNINQRPIVKVGDSVARGDVIADSASTDIGELALGQNMLVAFMPWNGYNFEDSILISERVVMDDRYTSIHIEELNVVARDTKLGSEEITRDISNLAETQLGRLDESGIIYIGAEVEAGDVLVGKVTPKGETQLTPEEKLLRAIFGEKASDVKDTSLRVPSGMNGTVIDVQVFTREGIHRDKRAQQIIDDELRRYRLDLNDQLRIVEGDAFLRLEKMLVGQQAKSGPKQLKNAEITRAYLTDLDSYHWFDLHLVDEEAAAQLEAMKKSIEQKRHEFELAFEKKRKKLTQGDELPPGVLKMVKVYLAVKRRLQPGDKMAGRHGNKGVVSKIVPVEDMPYMADGTPVDMVLNPLGVPSRMNVGQILETHLGWAAKGLGQRIGDMLRSQGKVTEIRNFLKKIYSSPQHSEPLDTLSNEEVLELARNLQEGVPFATPVFDGASEADISNALDLAYPEKIAKQLGLTKSKNQVTLYDGQTGEAFERPVTVGYMHMLKLHHLVDDKMHARSTGPYSLVTQQPLGGKAQFGGQRFGEMEVWALEAYGASYALQEMLTVKSDDVAGRTKVYENLVKGEHVIDAGMPESFNVLVKEIRSLGIDIDLARQNSAPQEGGVKALLDIFKQVHQDDGFNAVKIGLASPEKIRSWSFGEVKKPETINYRTFKPERDGLFCARIFGPIKDYECLCGKYKRLKHRGVICEKCGVEVTLAKVRRERMGHIELASPVAHIWFLKSLPSRLGMALDMTLRDIERVLYFEAYVIVEPGMTPLKRGQIMTEEDYYSKVEEYGDEFHAEMGAEGIRALLRSMDLGARIEQLRADLKATGSEAKIKKFAKRLKLLEAFQRSGIRPEWMVFEVLPVLPPDLRPLVPLDGGRFATSDLNDLYRRVINRNNRLKRLLELRAPEIIVRNEKRMLQEAVDSLLDNGRRGKAMTGANKRPLKSLSDMIKGKSGRFRQNLLGKRVDYSGRSVIVVGPELKLHQCGLPKLMALELFKPFIFHKLEVMGVATTIKAAKKEVENQTPVVWDILEEVIREHPVLLNRAPTLHRLGIQAFEPLLIEGKAIQLHPLVCAAFNADFDGDQMAVHVPLSLEAQLEARTLMLASNNVLFPANGEPSIVPSQDIVLGLYYATRERMNGHGEGMAFATVSEAICAYENKEVDLTSKAQVRIIEHVANPDFDEKAEASAENLRFLPTVTQYDTTVGRAILSEILPAGLPFSMLNKALKKKEISRLINAAFRRCGLRQTVIFTDQLMQAGFKLATRAGLSICVDDMLVPPQKEAIIAEAAKKVKEYDRQYMSGLVTAQERYNNVVDIWSATSEAVGKAMMEQLSVERVTNRQGKSAKQESFNSIYMMAESGARGSAVQIRQLAGMRGLMAKPDGSIIETPITANFREGLNVQQYFISMHGARKGLADTALKTANSGYLTRRLVDVAQDLVVVEEDCGTTNGVVVKALIEGGEVIETLHDRILGRVLAEEVFNSQTQEILFEAGTLLTENEAETIESLGIDEVRVRTPLTCEMRYGLCAKCYGRDLGRGALVNVGEAVGVIAAQSIGEPGTQLTMRTFHIGGAALRAATVSNVEAKSTGTIRFTTAMRYITNSKGEQIVISRSGEIMIIDDLGRERERHKIPYGATILHLDGKHVKAGTQLAFWDPLMRPIITEYAGTVKFENVEEGITVSRQIDELTGLSTLVVIDPKRRTLQAAKTVRPQMKLLDEQGQEVKIPGTDHAVTIGFQAGALILVKDGQQAKIGEVLARIPTESQKTRDITGGLPRVAELFEARAPKDAGILAEVTGTVSFGKDTKGKQRLVITEEEGTQNEFLISKDKQVLAHDGQTVNKGEVIVDGPANPHDILRLQGVESLARYIVDEVQDVYRLQGVKINDKHIEVIVRQMLRRVQIVDPADTRFILGEQVERSDMLDENDRVTVENGRPAIYQNVLLGITNASLLAPSVLAALAFQQTTSVMVRAATEGVNVIASESAAAGAHGMQGYATIDKLRGLKENVMLGLPIPAGTGFAATKARLARARMERERFAQNAQEVALAEVPEAPEAPDVAPAA